MKRVAVPVLQTSDQQLKYHADAVKMNIDILTGQLKASESLSQLSTSASTAEIINALNVIIRRLNGS